MVEQFLSRWKFNILAFSSFIVKLFRENQTPRLSIVDIILVSMVECRLGRMTTLVSSTYWIMWPSTLHLNHLQMTEKEEHYRTADVTGRVIFWLEIWICTRCWRPERKEPLMRCAPNAMDLQLVKMAAMVHGIKCLLIFATENTSGTVTDIDNWPNGL